MWENGKTSIDLKMTIKTITAFAISCFLIMPFCLTGQVQTNVPLGDPFDVDASMVSIYRLLSKPEDFDGKTVTVAGFVERGANQGKLFVSREDTKIRIPRDTIELYFEEGCSELIPGSQYAYVRGAFKVDPLSGLAGRLVVKKANPLPGAGLVKLSGDAQFCLKFIELLDGKRLADLTQEEEDELKQFLSRQLKKELLQTPSGLNR